MGHAIGTGGDVFQNVCDMDMNEPTPQFDVYGNTIKVIPI